jgi:hypothetical protein
MKPKLLLTTCAALALSGCGASLPGLTTGSLFGGDSAPKAPQITNDPTTRAMQVGSTAARAQKCGFNFDPVKLKTNFLAAETPALTNPADAGKLSQIYDTAFSGISKAVANQGEGYCTAQKTRTIKEALNRHLAGDYTPTPPEPQPEEEGLFGSLSSDGSSPGVKQTLPTNNLE